MKFAFTALIAGGAIASAASAHDGRRFDIQLFDNNQLYAQGYISGDDPQDDGGGVVRPYINAIHGHWQDIPAPGIQGATADLPGFDLFEGGPLTGFTLDLTLTGATKWVNPPMMPQDGTIPDLQALHPGEDIFVSFGADQTVSTAAPGTLTLIETVTPGGLADIDLSYDIADEPRGVLYVLQFELSSTAPGVLASDSVYVILSPDGDNMMERLHHAALYLEHYLGAPVPGPATSAAFGMFAWTLMRRSR